MSCYPLGYIFFQSRMWQTTDFQATNKGNHLFPTVLWIWSHMSDPRRKTNFLSDNCGNPHMMKSRWYAWEYFKNTPIEVPGWLSWLSDCLWLRSWSQGPRIELSVMSSSQLSGESASPSPSASTPACALSLSHSPTKYFNRNKINQYMRNMDIDSKYFWIIDTCVKE